MALEDKADQKEGELALSVFSAMASDMTEDVVLRRGREDGGEEEPRIKDVCGEDQGAVKTQENKGEK
jgi:hypothetical protein